MAVLLGLIIFISYTIQAMTGFGSIVLAITFGSFFYPVKAILPILVMLDLILNLYIILRHFSHTNTGLLLRKILPIMLAGVVLGLSIFKNYAVNSRWLLGLVVTFLAGFEIFNLHHRREGRVRPEVLNFFIFGAGIVEGMYASGGALLVYALNRLDLHKSAFRSTLSFLWIVMDTVLIIAYVYMGVLGQGEIVKTFIYLPIVAVSLFIGETLHFKVNERSFRLVVLYVLLIGGISILSGR